MKNMSIMHIKYMLVLVFAACCIILLIYLRDDDGMAVVRCGGREGCYTRAFANVCCFCCPKRRETIIHSQVSSSSLRKSMDTAALSVQRSADAWFRPEKFKILLSFLQIFSAAQSNYEIRWPGSVSNYMRLFS